MRHTNKTPLEASWWHLFRQLRKQPTEVSCMSGGALARTKLAKSFLRCKFTRPLLGSLFRRKPFIAYNNCSLGYRSPCKAFIWIANANIKSLCLAHLFLKAAGDGQGKRLWDRFQAVVWSRLPPYLCFLGATFNRTLFYRPLVAVNTLFMPKVDKTAVCSSAGCTARRIQSIYLFCSPSCTQKVIRHQMLAATVMNV